MTDDILSPDTLLSNLRSAFKFGHVAVSQMTFTILDAWLCEGGMLPGDWQDGGKSLKPPPVTDDLRERVYHELSGEQNDDW